MFLVPVSIITPFAFFDKIVVQKSMNKKKKIPLNAYLAYINEKSSLIAGIYFSCFLIFALFTGNLIIFPFFTDKFYLIFSYQNAPEAYLKNCLFMFLICLACFADVWLSRREKDNTLKYDVYDVPRKKRPYNEIWRLKILGVFLLIVFFLFLITFLRAA